MKATALQTAVYGVLSGDATLVAMLSSEWGTTAVFADVPQENADDAAFYPFISFGPDLTTRMDDKDTDGGNALLQVNIWSRTGDYAEAKDIAGRIHDLLHRQALTITGAHHIETVMEEADFSLDPDGETRRGQMQFRVTYQQS